ncbi:fused (3R)-hydroxyacyl-ACP dehydratase subunits HadA/HadB [Nocardia sp. NPDC057668]|uniref:fused (3R)-hydroxyacyl-ACP dehydratase subunits HadA/HadB n=1 Tax=Nocardia sp. NPDC057668 TaxID=3346202 RepID=UPI0036717B50
MAATVNECLDTPVTAPEPGDGEGGGAAATLGEMVGRQFRLRDHYEVGREKVREYARAVQAEHRLHFDDEASAAHGLPRLIAPPTFAALLAAPAQTALTDQLSGCDLTTAVQTQQHLELHRPIVVGDRLSSTIALRSHREAFGGDLMLVDNYIRDQYGCPVVTSHTSVIARSGGSDIGRALSALNPTILRHDVRNGAAPEVVDVTGGAASARAETSTLRGLDRRTAAVGDALPTRQFRLSYGDLVHYAGLSGDPNPIHWYEPATALTGLGPGVVAHGMLTMGLGASYLTGWARDPRALREYSVRWTSPALVVPGRLSVIEFTGKVAALHRDSGLATVAIGATQNGRRLFGRATATVKLG